MVIRAHQISCHMMWYLFSWRRVSFSSFCMTMFDGYDGVWIVCIHSKIWLTYRRICDELWQLCMWWILPTWASCLVYVEVGQSYWLSPHARWQTHAKNIVRSERDLKAGLDRCHHVVPPLSQRAANPHLTTTRIKTSDSTRFRFPFHLGMSWLCAQKWIRWNVTYEWKGSVPVFGIFSCWH